MDLDVPVFYDEVFEANFLGKAWTKKFKEIFADESAMSSYSSTNTMQKKSGQRSSASTLHHASPMSALFPFT
ncbi:hypothetical protein BWR59_06175 [Pseudomonas sp. Bc-h]|nr:hypothetical protein BWR59_06175 [Pseudomonas sp. Bc-h]